MNVIDRYKSYKIEKKLSKLNSTDADLIILDTLITKCSSINNKPLLEKLTDKSSKIRKSIEIEISNKKIEQDVNSLAFENELSPIFTLAKSQHLYEAANKTNKPELIEKAFTKMKSIQKTYTAIEKGKLEDPLIVLGDALGYKNKITNIDWGTLRSVAYSQAVRPVHQKIIKYVSKFAKPQKDKFSIGFFWERCDGKPLSKHELDVIIPELNKFTLQTGKDKNNVRGDFEQFVSAWTWNSLTYDHPPVEVVWDSKQELCFFRNLDAETVKIADTYYNGKDGNFGRKEVDGNLPAYVQMIHNEQVAEFYDWELWLSKRNPSSSVLANGYGRSEIEDLLNIIVGLLNAIKYNSDSFIEGIPASSLLWLKGGSSQLKQLEQQLRSYKQNINASTTLGISTDEKPEVIKVRDNNKDMEYSQFLSFLYSLITSAYGLIPESIGFRGSAAATLNFDSNIDQRVRTNLNQAIEPILTCLESGYNRSISCYLYNGEYRLRFGGYDGETKEQLQDRLVKVAGITPFNSILEQLGEPKDKNLPEGWVLSPQYIQSIQILEQIKQGQVPQDQGEQKPQPSQQPENDIKKGLEIDYLIEKLY